MKGFNSELVRKFAVYSLLAFTLTGIGLSTIVSKHIVLDAINSKTEMVRLAMDTAASTAQSEVQSRALTGTSADDTYLNQLNLNLRAIGVSDYYIWDNTDLLVRHLLPSKQEGDIPSPQLRIGGTNPLSTTHEILTPIESPYEKLLKINMILPSITENQRYSIAVIFPYGEIEVHQDMLIKNIVYIIGSGLLLLYVLLIRVLTNASKTLIRQKDNLAVKTVELQRAYEQLNVSFHSTVQALADAVDARDPYTAGHVGRVMEFSKIIGHALGLDHNTNYQLMLAAQMHDIGKIGVSDAVLLKPERLTDAEYEIIKTHPEIGVGILKNIPDFDGILPAVKHHHERFDGNGYPSGLSGHDIPLEARIIAVADAYDAMTTNRPYRSSLGEKVALNELIRNRGTQFDPEIADVFVIALGKLPVKK